MTCLLSGKPYTTGTYTDDFNDGTIASSYYTKNVSKISESGGYLQLNQNQTDNGPYILMGYDSEDNRYISIKFEDYHYRNNEHYSSQTRIIFKSNNLGVLPVYTTAHEEYGSIYGVTYVVYPLTANYSMEGAYSFSQLSSTERFDQWFDVQIIIDKTAKLLKVYINAAILNMTKFQ